MRTLGLSFLVLAVVVGCDSPTPLAQPEEASPTQAMKG